MNASKARRLAGDLVRVNARYLNDGVYRNTIRERLHTIGIGSPSVEAEEARRSPVDARAFRGLVETSLALSGMRTARSPRHLNVVLGEVRAGAAFAGVQTAVSIGIRLADRLGLPLRVVMVSWTTPGNSSVAAGRVLAERFPSATIDVVAREEILDHPFGDDDLWLATHWKTAHALDVAATAGLVRRDHVSYLIQDYEPGFSPWSTEYAVARSTYRCGFRLLVNSSPLQSYLRSSEGIEVDDALTFAPHLDLEILERVATGRRRDDVTRVLFYGRPSKHRNLFRVGIAALKIANDRLADSGLDVAFASAGEVHRDVDLGHRRKLVSTGTLPWDDYFEFLSRHNVVLSLQLSPHPSHPPFDGAISGAHVVTNDFAGTRRALHPNITAVEPDPVSLGTSLATTVRRAAEDGPSAFTPLADGVLGVPMEDAVATLAERLGELR